MSRPVQYKAVNLATATPVSVTTEPSELISIRPSVVMSAHAVPIQDGATVAGVAEVVTMTAVDGLTAGQTYTVAGLTFTSTENTTTAQLLAAFADLADGATTGAGTDEGTYSGALTGYTTSEVVDNVVTFTAVAEGATTDLVASGTGAVAARLAVTTAGVTPVTEVATMTGAGGLTAGQTYTVAGLTFTSTAVTTQAQLLAAFANLKEGATTGAGTAQGAYTGTLTGYRTGPVINNVVRFTSMTEGVVTDLTDSGTGAGAAVIAVAVQGVDGVAEVATMTGGKVLTADQTYSIAGLTFTSTGVTTQAQLLAAFASLDDGDDTGAGTEQGEYSGALTGWSTSAVVDGVVTFTSTAVSDVPSIFAEGTGADVATVAVATPGVTPQGTLIGTLPASSAITTRYEFDGITLNRGIHLVPNASSTGTVIVAYRLI
jgi:hypothetical protein